MTVAAVRQWLRDTIAPVGITVYDEPLVIGAAGDLVTFTRFPAHRAPASFGGVGALIETDYTPSLLVLVQNPSSEQPQHILDGYVETICDLLRSAPTPAAISDPLTGATSELMLVGDIQADPAPTNALTATVLVPQLTEYSVRSS